MSESQSRLVDPQPSEVVDDPNRGNRLEGQTFEPKTQLEPQADTGSDYVAENENLKRKLGQQGNEIGELRKALQALQSQQPEPEPVDYFDDPARAIHQQTDPLKQELDQIKGEMLKSQLRAKHGDYEHVVATPEFAEWVQAKRQRMAAYAQADAGDVEAADELLSDFKAEKGGETPSREKAKRKASAGSGEKASSRSPRGNVYRRTELQNMKAYSPQRYNELLPDIKQAYRDGRVID
jgi:aryl carrier-like protein